MTPFLARMSARRMTASLVLDLRHYLNKNDAKNRENPTDSIYLEIFVAFPSTS
jgi:hypothetical protein